jgi:hypothetical protein
MLVVLAVFVLIGALLLIFNKRVGRSIFAAYREMFSARAGRHDEAVGRFAAIAVGLGMVAIGAIAIVGSLLQ